MKIVLFENYASERGVTASILNLAEALQEHLGAEVAYSYSLNHEKSNNPNMLAQIEAKLKVIPFGDRREFDKKLVRQGYDYFYSQKSGRLDKWFSPSIRNLNHAVFQVFEPHGHRYAYISKTLAEQVKYGLGFARSRAAISSLSYALREVYVARSINEGIRAYEQVSVCENSLDFDYVPHVVPSHGDFAPNLRSDLGIPKSGFVIGSLSGSSEFNVGFVRTRIISMLDADSSLWFLAPNVASFTSHPRALFLPTITNAEVKRNYLNTLDVLVHARVRGESFGLAIAEAMAAGKPVVSWSGGIDQNHVNLVGPGGLYSDEIEFTETIRKFREDPPPAATQMQRVTGFTPEKVAEKFQHVFLD
jgi:glycosyltransferase involved in cell wall biosynthesis